MTRLTIFDQTNAPAAARGVLSKAKAQYGFVPNVLGEMAGSPTALEAYAAMNQAFGRSGLTAIEQQIVLLTTSFANNCEYCVAVHSTLALDAGLDRDVIMTIRDGEPIRLDARLEALRQFTLAIVRERGLVERSDVDAFLKAGFTKANVLDVIHGVTVKTMTNYINHIAETPLDEAFKAMAWSKPILSHAN
ncbi:carboxymuconolactone decarboxylase family protein [Maricaulis parjimensis]|uniref:carboxymuconolactone decarboxylase family protein n=1 Tax=Maricaulis parjimensis TaxID=144023 RepID=UPI001939B7E3|nr:carboxymuconolactone decarboxylase family protein [Maricaulis parjimensis]